MQSTRDEETPLSLVNQARVMFGGKPLDALPSGIPRSYTDCPIARALADCLPPKARPLVFGDRIKVRGHQTAMLLYAAWFPELPPYRSRFKLLPYYDVPVPACLRQFVNDFDKGQFSWLSLSFVESDLTEDKQLVSA